MKWKFPKPFLFSHARHISLYTFLNALNHFESSWMKWNFYNKSFPLKLCLATPFGKNAQGQPQIKRHKNCGMGPLFKKLLSYFSKGHNGGEGDTGAVVNLPVHQMCTCLGALVLLRGNKMSEEFCRSFNINGLLGIPDRQRSICLKLGLRACDANLTRRAWAIQSPSS